MESGRPEGLHRSPADQALSAIGTCSQSSNAHSAADDPCAVLKDLQSSRSTTPANEKTAGQSHLARPIVKTPHCHSHPTPRWHAFSRREHVPQTSQPAPQRGSIRPSLPSRVSATP